MTSIYYENDLDFLKWQAELQAEHMHLPRAASAKLKEILMDDNISTEEFKTQLQDIFLSTRTISWQIRNFFSELNLASRFKTLVFQFPWFEVFLLFGIFFVGYLLYQRLKTNKIFKKILELNYNFFVRLIAAGGYFFPFLEIMNTYAPPLVRTYPYLKFILSDFIKISLFFYQSIPLAGFVYFCIVYGFFIRNRYPRNRLIRYHYALGLMIMNLHQPITQIYHPMIKGCHGNQESIESISIIFFIVILINFIPCIYWALRGEYTKGSFLRDAVEIILGRDNHDPTFKWWDR